MLLAKRHVSRVAVSACSAFVPDDWAGMAIIRDCDALFCDGYETGDARAWSAAVGGP